MTFLNAIPVNGHSRVMKVIIWIMSCQKLMLTLKVKDGIGKISKLSKKSLVANLSSSLAIGLLMANTNLVNSDFGQHLIKESK